MEKSRGKSVSPLLRRDRTPPTASQVGDQLTYHVVHAYGLPLILETYVVRGCADQVYENPAGLAQRGESVPVEVDVRTSHALELRDLLLHDPPHV